MHYIQQGARGVLVLVGVNWDRLLFAGALAAALGVGTWLASLML